VQDDRDASIVKACDVCGSYPDQMDEWLAHRIRPAFPGCFPSCITPHGA